MTDADELALAEALAAVLAENPALPALTDNQRAGLVRHGGLLLRWNRVHNLTRVEAPMDVARRHWADSLAGLSALLDGVPTLGATVADVGSGAGFPGVVAALLWPSREVTLIEAARKRASFLQRVARELGLTNLNIDNRRLEEVEAGTVDAVITRATLPWQQLTELGRLLVPGGWLGAWVAEDPSEAAWREHVTEAGFVKAARLPYQVSGLPERAVGVAQLPA